MPWLLVIFFPLGLLYLMIRFPAIPAFCVTLFYVAYWCAKLGCWMFGIPVI